MAEVKFRFTIIAIIYFLIFFSSHSKALDVIRDIELEDFTNKILYELLKPYNLGHGDINIYFVKSDQINAFVTGGKNMFINTEILIASDDYREYAAVLAHELAHIINGHIFNTSIEISNLSNKALPIYLLGIISIIAGSSDAGVAGVMVGQASVADGFTYYSRTQEASADQSAVNILCKSKINAEFLISFLEKIEANQKIEANNDYRSTHPLIENRISWINSSLENTENCDFKKDELLEKQFELLKAKLHAFTHPYSETEAVYNSNRDRDLYATAVSNYFMGNLDNSINNLEILMKKEPENPYYKELIGEVYFASQNYDKASKYQLGAIEQIEQANDLYHMMMGNYLLSFEKEDEAAEAILQLKKSLQINPKNAYSWYLLARAYAFKSDIALANYATAERYFLIGERQLSFDFAQKALKSVKEKSPEWYRSFDLIEVLKKDFSNK